MKKSFLEYNSLDQVEISQLWEQAIFIFDTNVLPNLYRYSSETSNEFVQIISGIKDRVWIPYQVGLEFNKNRLQAISDQIDNYSSFEKKLNDLSADIKNKNRNPFFSHGLTEKFLKLQAEFKIEIDSKSTKYHEDLTQDNLLNTINDIFINKVGSQYDATQLSDIYKDGEKRYKDKVPPGYCDARKPNKQKFGDLIVWRQLIDKSKDSQVDVIFVLDDNKEDWWLKHKGKTISPRPELLKEFRENTDKNIHFYKPFQFLEYSNEFLNSSVNIEIIEEVKSYKPNKVDPAYSSQIKIIVKGDTSDIELLLNDLKSSGYNCYCDLGNNIEFHHIYVYLSNIPDMERRLKSKYTKKMSDYNIVLIDIEKI